MKMNTSTLEEEKKKLEEKRKKIAAMMREIQAKERKMKARAMFLFGGYCLSRKDAGILVQDFVEHFQVLNDIQSIEKILHLELEKRKQHGNSNSVTSVTMKK
ncbi:MAG: hypothetical protein ABIM64_04705 [candidate division WOR-3 bacterium]